MYYLNYTSIWHPLFNPLPINMLLFIHQSFLFKSDLYKQCILVVYHASCHAYIVYPLQEYSSYPFHLSFGLELFYCFFVSDCKINSYLTSTSFNSSQHLLQVTKLLHESLLIPSTYFVVILVIPTASFIILSFFNQVPLNKDFNLILPLFL